MKRFFLFFLKLYVYSTALLMTVILIIGVVESTILLSPNNKSYCVIVEKISDFNGKYLKVSNYKEEIYGDTKTCVALDEKYDLGDGKNKGKVRWIQCKNEYSSKSSCKKIGNH